MRSGDAPEAPARAPASAPATRPQAAPAQDKAGDFGNFDDDIPF